ncbi:SpoIIE family protein phosphatase [Streptomyces sp. NBC_01764]|uniref:ATP-binding SpoIIE family protein phosphatase n=1 Tax=Streptomyces sp. NBC_01764 TaxID=2975935 RepID=UPI00225A1853|nr:SpoIIE family protein phosphatase [Streptomyces sp. NBC_01764]MCX4403921.1 SpoIIE family protein phosphatase [Streptomyces sp. NBC_01764]
MAGKQEAGYSHQDMIPPAVLAGRGRVLTEVFYQLVQELGAFHGIVYLASRERDQLFSVAVGGAPPGIFAVPECILANSSYASAVAYRTARTACQADLKDEYSLRLMPYPHYVVAVPLTVGGETFGVLTGQWAPTDPHEQRRVLLRMEELGRNFGPELAKYFLRYAGAWPVESPLIIPMFPRSPTADGPGVSGEHRWGLSDVPGSPALSKMYQVHKLSAALNEAFELGAVMRAALECMMLPFGAQSFVAVIAQEGRLRVVGHAGATDVARALHGASLDRRLPGADVLRTGVPLFLPDREAMLALYSDTEIGNLQAAAIIPLVASGGLQGSFLLGFETPRRVSAEEQAVLLMMTTQLAVATERAQLGESKRAFTDALQQKLLPRTLPEFPDVAVTARYVPAESVTSGMGGDWYDAIPLPGGQIGLIVGDVEGHNADSAVIMGQLRSGCRAYAAEGHKPADVLARSSDLLTELDTDLYATCCFVRIDPESGIAEIALAGHPAPLVRCPLSGILVPDFPANVPLAVVPGHVYVSKEIDIRPGTLFFLYTDGLGGDPVSDAHALLASAGNAGFHSLHELADALVANASKGGRRSDDLALLLALYEGNLIGSADRVARMAIKKRDIRSVRSARKFVRNYLLSRELEALIDDAEIMISEIVTNALIHADSDVEVMLREYPDRIYFEVRDTDARPPVPTSVIHSDEENAVAEHGRGLDIVEDLSAAWGTSPHGRGKSVWLDLRKTGALRTSS